MMLHVLRDKFLRLGRDEDGVALVTTLAVFMFMYLVCMGVYAIGTAVKTRIHLQNACDAAAYSAAVVQADTLSRIATINRAMSWTYVQMTRRQMDYIVYKWLDHAQRHVFDDARSVIRFGNSGEQLHQHPYWYVGGRIVGIGKNGGYKLPDPNLSTLSVNGTTRSFASVAAATTGFQASHLPGERARVSFYSRMPTIQGLWGQIDDDKTTILDMNTAVEELADKMPAKIQTAAEAVCQANLDPKWKVQAPLVKQSMDPRYDYMRVLDGSEELRFLAFSEYYPSSSVKPFGNGSARSEWFPLTGNGIKRSYTQRKKLFAEWYSWACSWYCSKLAHCYFVPTTPSCFHSCTCKSGSCDRCRGITVRHAYLEAGHLRPDDERMTQGDLYEGVVAKPLVLKPDYFGADGTISVGVARENENPWSRILGKVTGGLFSAFEPFTGKTVVFSSAKAGYKHKNENPPVLGSHDNRGYRIDWNGIEDWNLCQSDWDAVLIPVRMARTMAESGRWSDAERFLSGWISDLGVSSDEMRAGGTVDWQTAADGEMPRSGEYPVGAWTRQGARPSHTDAVQARWQIGKPGGNVRWNDLTDRMFH